MSQWDVQSCTRWTWLFVCYSSGHYKHSCYGGNATTIFGKQKTLIIWLHLIIGDIQGDNNLATAYQNSGVWPYYVCKHGWDDLDADILSCEFATIKVFQQYKVLPSGLSRTASRDVMKQVSCHDIDTVWEKWVPLSDTTYDINIITPQEI